MNKHLVTLTLTLCVTTIAAAVWATNGIVVNTEGKGVPKARVYAFLGETPNSEKILIHTDRNGKFEFKPAKAGRYYYLADAKGYAFAMACDKLDTPGNIIIRLWPDVSLTGQVVDPDGKPVTNATVGMHAFDAWEDPADVANGAKPWIWFRDEPSFLGSVKTDKKGMFKISRIPDPTCFKTIKLKVDVTAPGRAPSFRIFSKPETSSNLTIVSSLACTLTGTFHLPKDSGVAPQTIGLMVYHALQGASPSRRTSYLDKNGHFAFNDLPQGKVFITLGNKTIEYDDDLEQPVIIGQMDFVPAGLPTPVLTPEKPTNIDIDLHRAAVVTGKVIDKATGKPVSGGFLHAISVSQTPNQVREFPIEYNGQFTAKIGPGKYKLFLFACIVGGKYLSINSYDGQAKVAPTKELDLADGEEKSGVIFEIDSKDF